MNLPWVPAVVAALLWAASTPLLNHGLSRLPESRRLSAVLLGLLLSQFVGALTLTLVTWSRAALFFDPWLVAGGVLTFALGTGLYYLSGYAFGGRMQLAAQFAKVKPLLSLLLAVVLLNETLRGRSWLAAVFIVAGVVLLTLAGERGRAYVSAVALGLATALAWALGEVCMKLADPPNAIAATTTALQGSLLISAPVILVFLVRQPPTVRAGYLVPFAIHGLVSFGLAYAAFFASLYRIGLGQSVLITAAWPALALLLTALVDRLRGRPVNVGPKIWLASALLLLGIFIHLSGMHLERPAEPTEPSVEAGEG